MNNPTACNDTTKKRLGSASGPVLKGGDRDARKTAALVLEVLAGELNPAEAAEILEVSLPRYYQIEKRALEGLIRACCGWKLKNAARGSKGRKLKIVALL